MLCRDFPQAECLESLRERGCRMSSSQAGFLNLYTFHCSNVNWPRPLCFFSQRPHQWSGFLGLPQRCLAMNGTFRGLLTGTCVLPHMRSMTLFSKRGFKWKQDAQTIQFDLFLVVSRSKAMVQIQTGRRKYWNEGTCQSHQYNLQHVFKVPRKGHGCVHGFITDHCSFTLFEGQPQPQCFCSAVLCAKSKHVPRTTSSWVVWHWMEGLVWSQQYLKSYLNLPRLAMS